jgi:hypothetical protein
MHARIARYRIVNGEPHELATKAEQGMLPIFRLQPGFVSYTLVASDGEIGSFTTWETAEEAEAATAAAADWVRDNIADDLDLIETRVGEVLLSTSLGLSALAISS